MSYQKPTIFISSTYYDLRQVRADLFHFLEEHLGYRALAFERTSFPVDPSDDTTENSTRAVFEQADCLVLIVGGRYGVPPSDSIRSVTNLEYLMARRKGVPIYVFIDKRIRYAMEHWRANPRADFSHAVNTTKLFDFVQEIEDGHRAWCFYFESAQEIIHALREQLAHLFAECLAVHLQTQRSGLDVADLQGPALRIALGRGECWEARLFVQALRDELAKYRDLRWAFDRTLALGAGDVVSDEEAPRWLDHRLAEIIRIYESVKVVLESVLGGAAAKDDARLIVFCARRIGVAYKQALEWVEKLRLAHCSPSYQELLRTKMALLARDVLDRLQGLPAEIEDYLKLDPSAQPGRSPCDNLQVRVSITISQEILAEVVAALRRLAQP